ncbi:MAG: hypothetical protein Q9166_001367 [cf. Caloplaca sp. 2 TL-2023]
MSNIRVSVEWDRAAVFAGESIDCVITFRNVAQAPNSKRASTPTSYHSSPRERWKDNSAAHVRSPASNQPPLHSLGVTVTKEHRKTPSRDSAWAAFPAVSKSNVNNDAGKQQNIRNGNHRRSVSIVSVSGDVVSSENPLHAVSASRRPGQSHSRAASLQILPGKSIHGTNSDMHGKGSSVNMEGYGQAPAHDRASTVPAVLSSSTFSLVDDKVPAHELWSPEKPAAAPTLSRPCSRIPATSATSSPELPQNPRTSIAPSNLSSAVLIDDIGSSTVPQFARQDQSRSHLTRVLSPSSHDGSPRISTDHCSFSSNSSDTMVSEYVTQEHGRFLQHPASTRQRSHLAPSKTSQFPETLMMGYGNVVGSFHLDASLVNASSFDNVKRKAVVGNQGGGGVVRAVSTKRQSGLLGSLGWSALGESLEGLLGGSEVSSIKETANTNTAKWMPILSTPQSLLFVDLRLEPGQSQSYSYSFRLPAGLPPSYRGKAVKFSYNLVVGIQRATGSRQLHTVRHVDFPFRVLPSVNGME